MKNHALLLLLLLFAVSAAGCVRDTEPTVETVYSVGDECGANRTKVEPVWCTYKGSAPPPTSSEPVATDGKGNTVYKVTDNYELTEHSIGINANGKEAITCSYCTTCSWSRDGAFNPAGIACEETPTKPSCNPPQTTPDRPCHSETFELPAGWPQGDPALPVSKPPTAKELAAASSWFCHKKMDAAQFATLAATCTSQKTETLGNSCCVPSIVVNQAPVITQ